MGCCSGFLLFFGIPINGQFSSPCTVICSILLILKYVCKAAVILIGSSLQF